MPGLGLGKASVTTQKQRADVRKRREVRKEHKEHKEHKHV